MTRSSSQRAARFFTFAVITSAAALFASATYAQRVPSQMNPLDRSDLGRSKQDPNLRGIPVPATVTPLERVPVDRIKLPTGFKANVFAHGMPGARTMVQGPKGTIFVGSRTIGRVYAVTQKDGRTETKIILQGLTSPNGLAMHDGSLYVFAINKVFRYDNIEESLDKLPEAVDLSAAFNLPTPSTAGSTWHSALTASSTSRLARTATFVRSTRRPMRISADTTPTAQAWKSWRAACVTRSGSIGIL